MRRSTALYILTLFTLLTPLTLYGQGYGGPSLLSRGGNTPGKRGRAPVDFNFYASVRGAYESGLIGPTLNDNGNLDSAVVKGVQAEVGVYGAHSWRRTSIGLDYRGDYRNYSQFSSFNGSNQALSLDIQHQRRRMGFFLREAGGTTNRAFGGFSAPAFVDSQNFGVPLNEVYDSRVYFSQTSGGMVYRTSARTSFQVSGDGFIVKRRTRALIGLQGYRGGGRVEHRLTRTDTVGLQYDYIHFEYPRVFGSSGVHMVSATYQKAFTRNLTGEFTGGFYQSHTIGTQRVTLSPEVAAILGRSMGVEAFDRTDTEPRIEGKLSYTLEHSKLTFGLTSGVGPGNGLYLTSRQDSVNGGYSYTGIRRLSLGLSAGYTRYRSLALTLGGYNTVQGGGGLSYKLRDNVNFTVQVDRRKFDSPGVSGRTGTAITAGLSFSLSKLPLSIW